jgi:hypothetical protein
VSERLEAPVAIRQDLAGPTDWREGIQIYAGAAIYQQAYEPIKYFHMF